MLVSGANKRVTWGMADVETPYRLNLLGTFRLNGPAGERVDVASKKGMALIALLAMAPDGERSRGWLQDKLWGSRQQDQARSSLRRELSNLRKLINPEGFELLACERDRVRLDLASVSVDARDEALRAEQLATQEFLEGIDIAGEEDFEDWLREQRSLLRTPAARAPAPARPPPPEPTRLVDVSQPAPGFDGRPALAVLPFENLTGDAGDDYLAEGISEDLIDRLSRLRWLPVIARSSSFALGSDAVPATVSARLGAKYLLEGRLRKIGGDYWLSTSLSDAESGYVLWSPRVKLPEAGALDALQPLTADLVAVLESRIDHAEQARALAKPQSDLNVGDLIWRGRWHLNRFTRSDAEKARALFDQALALEPNSPEALIQATFSLGWTIWAQLGSEDEIQAMRRLAQRAIVADCDDSRGYLLAGVAEMWLRRPQRGKTLLEKAIALNPSLALAYVQLAGCHNFLAEPEPAIAAARAALRLSPNDMHLFNVLGELACSHAMLERWDEAVDYADEAIMRRPAYWYGHTLKINALVRRGDLAAAAVAFDELMAARPQFTAEHLDWVRFADRKWNDYWIDGLVRASGGRLARTAPPAPG